MDIEKIIYFLKDIEKRMSGDSAEAVDRAMEAVGNIYDNPELLEA